MKNTW